MFSRLFCALPRLAFGQDVQLCMVAVQTSGSPCSLERGSGQALVRVFGSANHVNVDIAKPILRRLRVCAKLAGVVVAVGEELRLNVRF